MAKVVDLLKTGTTVTLLIDGWNWWLDEIRAMIPPTLTRLFVSQPDWLVLDVSENSLIVGQIVMGAYRRFDSVDLLEANLPSRPSLISSSFQKPGMSEDRVAVTLAPRQVLIRELDLPLTAPRHLRALVQHELERSQPLPTDQIYFDCRIIRRDSAKHRMRVEIAVVKKTPVDRVRALLAGWGLTPRIIGLRDGAAWPVNFLRDQKNPVRLRLSVRGALAILAVTLSMAMVKVGFDRHDAYAEALRTAVASAKAAATEVEASRHQADAIADRLSFLTTVRRNGPAGPWLDALAQALPDGTWVVDVERHGQSLHLRGYSKNASGLIALLDASSWFANARFTAPLVPGQTPGLERFNLMLDLRAGPPA